MVDMQAMNVFVYGTLMRDEPNHSLIAGRFSQVRPATAAGRLSMGPGFPYMDIPQEYVLQHGTAQLEADADLCGQSYSIEPAGGWSRVEGELYTFDRFRRDVLERLDRLEGFDPRHRDRSLYLRVLTQVTCDDGTQETAWAYVSADPGRHPLPHGSWKKVTHS